MHKSFRDVFFSVLFPFKKIWWSTWQFWDLAYWM